jgi:hypothetical protein
MFMRHFGLGVGHLQFERQHEIESNCDLDTENSEPEEEMDDGADEEESNNVEMTDVEEGDWEGGDYGSDLDLDLDLDSDADSDVDADSDADAPDILSDFSDRGGYISY